MNNGKPNWWSRPSSTPEAARIPSPPPSGDGEGDFPLPAPQPRATPEPSVAAVPAAPTEQPPAPSVVLTKGDPQGQDRGQDMDRGQDQGQDRVQVPEQAQVPAPEPVPAPPAPPADPAPAPQAQASQAQPLHAPDEYRTPPYGEPGPWAPAPPVQRLPGPVPPQQGPGHPVPPVPPQPQGPAPWGQYDPWGVGGAALPPAPAKRSRKGLAVAGALVFALLTGVIGGGIGAYVERNGGLTTVELPQAAAEDTGRAPDSVAGIAASALPGVVTLHVKGSGSSGTGTGFVLNTKGHILTNNHVVDGARSSADISVTFSSGETARAKLVGKDTGYDLAVVQVTGVSGLKPLPLGNSDNVRVGDPVVAIGAPFDLSNTVTSGIISAKERPITAGGEKGDGSDISYVDALQTDAPINPGNSGGPLLDSKARVIGINSAIRAAGGSGGDGEGGGASQPGSIGLGFAIPINQGKRVAEELIRTGKATHPVIGVSLDMQYDGDGARVGEKGKDGTASVTPGGPAAKAGLRPGDVITKVDGQRVHNGEELIVKIRAHRPGDRLELTLDRDGKELTKTLTLGSSQGT
ncbi:PDZ domain-containing protein [Streptomyces sp. SID5770]|uniref:trypsin-like peptidase domain-containing protein n=1 Tax=Streptomyces sp. SID5770 TaxID=2690308 RepID=UPI0013701F1D|nr:trypsin-like peptidase domain-containing protein [Streptomyces sp. SID5770]MZE50487.1 PDZ domain-containing protein [Streptomyces sp. SID5770]